MKKQKPTNDSITNNPLNTSSNNQQKNSISYLKSKFFFLLNINFP